MFKKLKFDTKAIISTAMNHKVEMVLFVMLYILDIFDILDYYRENLIVLTTVAIALTYSLNNLTKGRKLRFLYYTSWIVVYLSLLIIDNREWYTQSQAVILSAILSPLLIVLSGRNRDNNSFVDGVITLIASLAIATLFSSIIILLIYFIIETIVEIFSVGESFFDIVDKYIYLFVAYIATPLFFFYYSTQSFKIKERFSTLINYILTPAIILYAVMLYLYIIRTVIEWQLPTGGVAYLVFGFTIFSLAVKSLREMIEEKMFSKFFDNFSYIATPILLLFWIGVYERITQYGLTDWRVYLVVCGSIMTICIIMFMTKRFASYYLLTIIGFTLYAIIAFAPNFSAQDIAFRSQHNIAIKYLEKLNFIDDNGKIIKEAQTLTDRNLVKDYKQLSSSVSYIMNIDYNALKEYGVTNKDQIIDMIPEEADCLYYRGDDLIYLYYDEDNYDIDISNYSRIYNLNYSDKIAPPYINYYKHSDRQLSIYIDNKLYVAIPFEELIEEKINSIIEDNNIDVPMHQNIKRFKNRFNLYHNDSIMVIFEGLVLKPKLNNQNLMLESVTIDKVLVK